MFQRLTFLAKRCRSYGTHILKRIEMSILLLHNINLSKMNIASKKNRHTRKKYIPNMHALQIRLLARIQSITSAPPTAFLSQKAHPDIALP